MKQGAIKIIFVWSGVLLFCGTFLHGQALPLPVKDSLVLNEPLQEVLIQAFGQERSLREQPVAISLLEQADRKKFSAQSVVPAMNALPGVRMEQRSPGSYRLNIRGSSLRSPFGVRNTKVYYNGIPFTDPGGNTYLNQLSLRDMYAIKVIKGPSGSLYGAGTGGVLIIDSELNANNLLKQNRAEAEFFGGSFGEKGQNFLLQWGNERAQSSLRYTNLEADGYRHHTGLHQQTATYETRFKPSDREQWNAFFHYTNLFYQTPGALTKEEFDRNPRSARKASGIYPSAEESHASVRQRAFLVGLKHVYHLTDKWKNETSLYGAYTDFINPTFRNYEFRKEPHFGGRTVFQYEHSGTQVEHNFLIGGELQQGYFSQKDFGNVQGQPDTLQTIDRVNELSAFVFAQADFRIKGGWELNLGMSLNHRNLHFERPFPVHEADFRFKNHPVLAPRVVLSKKWGKQHLLFVSASRGFSPPTIAEILPSTAELNRDLQAEKGTQYELGSKGDLFAGNWRYEVNVFLTQLRQSISSRKDEGGGDYFVNAGNALQKGVEASLKGSIWHNPVSFVSQVDAWGSATLFDFTYKDYQVGDEDYSGRHFPGSANTNLVAGLDFIFSFGLQAHATFQHTSKIPLNDANTVYSKSYELLGLTLSRSFRLMRNLKMEAFIGAENLLNQLYSLGDDINAAAGRYYNLAPKRNFSGGVRVYYAL